MPRYQRRARAVRREAADFVLVDAPGVMGAAFGATIAVADLVLVPSGATVLDVRGAAETIGIIRRHRKAAQLGRPDIMIVPTRIDRRTGAGKDIVATLAALTEPVAPSVSYRAIVADSLASGETVPLDTPSGGEFVALADCRPNPPWRYDMSKRPNIGQALALQAAKAAQFQEDEHEALKPPVAQVEMKPDLASVEAPFAPTGEGAQSSALIAAPQRGRPKGKRDVAARQTVYLDKDRHAALGTPCGGSRPVASLPHPRGDRPRYREAGDSGLGIDKRIHFARNSSAHK